MTAPSMPTRLVHNMRLCSTLHRVFDMFGFDVLMTPRLIIAYERGWLCTDSLLLLAVSCLLVAGSARITGNS